MFDFHFGSREDIDSRIEEYLIFVKRMLPRWVNSIPDSEYLAIHHLLRDHVDNDHPSVIVETGIGASTFVLLHHAIKTGGTLLSWDINGAKAAFLRSVLVDTFARNFQVNLWSHWVFVPYSSTSDHLGISIAGELGHKVDFAFLDSEHTWATLGRELELVSPLLRDGAVVAIDDANYTVAHTNTAYVNMQRAKLDLEPVDDPPNNVCDPYYEETPRLLQQSWPDVIEIPTTYAASYKSDIFWEYFSADRSAMMKQGMEIADALSHRLHAWRVSGGQS